MAITTAISDLLSFIYELVASVFGAAYSVVHSFVAAITSFVTGIFQLIGDVLSGFVDVAGGVGKFVTGNIVLISIGALAAFAYVRYTASGQQLATQKKIN